MKNVTPAAGHVWNNRNHSDQVTVRSNIDGQIQYNRGICVFEMPYGQFIKSFEFVPQSDLERPTVGVPNIDMRSKHDFVISSDDRMMKEFENSPLLNDKLTDLQVYRCFSEKPKRKVYFGPSDRQHYDIARCYDDAVKLTEKLFMAHNKKETKMIDLSTTKFSTTKGVDAAKAFRELGKVIDNLNKQKETKMIDLTIGSTVIVDGGRDRWSDADHLVDVPVQIMAIFDGLGLDDGKSIPMVAVSDKTGSSCCFRADMCKPAKTDEEKAVGAMLVEMSTKMQLRGDHDDYMVNDDTQVGVEFVIEYMAANGFKWVGE